MRLVRKVRYFWRRRFCRWRGDLGCFAAVLFCLCNLLLFCPSSLALLAGVGPLVPGNGTLPCEPPRAHGASVGLLPGVRPLVPRNVALVGEA